MHQKEEESSCKENCRHFEELKEAKIKTNELMACLDILKKNFKDLNESSKSNIMESNRKWFQFSKDILILAKRLAKGEKLGDRLEKYEKFFGCNIDDLIYSSNDMSIFDKNSYFTEDISLIPEHISQKKIPEKK